MAITLAAINAVVLRQVFLPWFKQTSVECGIPLPANWNPDDAELDRLAGKVSQALREADEA